MVTCKFHPRRIYSRKWQFIKVNVGIPYGAFNLYKQNGGSKAKNGGLQNDFSPSGIYGQ